MTTAMKRLPLCSGLLILLPAQEFPLFSWQPRWDCTRLDKVGCGCQVRCSSVELVTCLVWMGTRKITLRGPKYNRFPKCLMLIAGHSVVPPKP